MLVLLCFFALLSVAVWSPSAHAEGETAPRPVAEGFQPVTGDTWLYRTTAIDGHLGFATPQGLLGVSLTQTFERTFALSGSVGLGATGPHLSVMPRVQLPWDWGAVGLGVGLTGSNYREAFTDFICFDSCSNTVEEADLMLWGNAELYVVFQEQASGWRFGLYTGVTGAVVAVNRRLVDEDTGEELQGLSGRSGLPQLVYLGLNLGYAF